jgi:hypothetical protein
LPTHILHELPVSAARSPRARCTRGFCKESHGQGKRIRPSWGGCGLRAPTAISARAARWRSPSPTRCSSTATVRSIRCSRCRKYARPQNESCSGGRPFTAVGMGRRPRPRSVKIPSARPRACGLRRIFEAEAR